MNPAQSKPNTNRERFVAACHCQPVDRPPVWLMRQAGRCLPEYRALKEKHSFTELVRMPELAAEVTLQPVRRFDFDAAILFSDILVVPEALGQAYHFRDQGGIAMDFALHSIAEVERLEPKAVCERLDYVRQALLLLKKQLGGRTALIGFSGAPWTLANFMMEGGSAKEFTRAKQAFYTDRALFDRLCEKLTRSVANYLGMQIQAGVDAIQIFDTLAGSLAGSDLEGASVRWIKSIIAELNTEVPIIVFCKGAHENPALLADTGADVLGADWTVRLEAFKARLPEGVGVQGNLDPFLLTTNPAVVTAQTQRLLTAMRGTPGHIFNLGHGVPPTAKLENIEALVHTVSSFV